MERCIPIIVPRVLKACVKGKIITRQTWHNFECFQKLAKKDIFDEAKKLAFIYNNNWVTHVKQFLIEFYERRIVKVKLLKITRLCFKQSGII